MKKLLAVLLAASSVTVFADSFQDFNNNLYLQYQLVSPNGGAAQNIDQWGVGGTFQSKNDFWAEADSAFGTSGTNGTYTQSSTLANLNVKAGYAFQFFNNEDNGLQIIPHIGFGMVQSGGAVGGTVYTYSIGVKPEYRLMNAFKLALDLNILGTQQGVSTNNYVNNGQDFAYSITPSIQYDINKTVMLGLDYTYTNSFNANNATSNGPSNGTNTLTAKVGYLF